MFKEKVVQEALNRTWDWDLNPGMSPFNPANGQDREIAMLIFNLFGGEILKTPSKKTWHYYNRINGERFDFTLSKVGKIFKRKRFKDIPSNPDEASQNVDQSDYFNFYMKFVKSFEEILGLKRHRILNLA
jgi:hypothetical protein